MNTLVEHILYLGQEEKGSINNLILNKVLCLSFRDYFHDYGKNELVQELYDNGFEIWSYGLAHVKQYREYKHFGRFAIRKKGIYHENLSDFDAYIHKWLNVSLREMVMEAQNYELWRTNIDKIQKGKQVRISLESI
ncbi:hypothetical protein CVD28_02770 [Bacillus sp. M6-12]|uniref:hypothetical protein n=1 Tax=Bacillus sp. M6-12 TaxID=2054166 RepID=UPI000C77FF85|nr:hypothetical protein [Bacillus sp. M6-12]PLS19355.1 hypothetical protein CVD28_02770 [Bacillus sp. M6-12]